MSILQEYEAIKKLLSEREFNNVQKFLERNPQYQLSDVYYQQEVHQKFEKWQIRHEKNHLSYFYRGLSNDPFISLSIENLVDELHENPDLKKHILEYAKTNLKENSLHDKSKTVHAIESMNIDTFYNSDTEVRENFCICFKGGIKTMNAELNEMAKQLNNEKKREESR